ncbi:uncharacterized protein LOC117593511 [Tachysurus ichikawai]
MNHVYRKPFEHNSERDKDLRHQYVQRVFEMDSIERPHEYIFVDEAGFNLGEEEKERLERRENIACDVDDVLWPDPTRRRDAEAE